MDEDSTEVIVSALGQIAYKLNILNEISDRLWNLEEIKIELVNMKDEITKIANK